MSQEGLAPETEFDELTLRIVEELVRKPHLTYKQIGSLVGCDQRTVARRIVELEEAGVVTPTVEIDWTRFGMRASAFVGVSTAKSPRASQLFHDYIQTDQRVVEAYETLGSNQFLLRVLENDVFRVRDTILRELDPLSGELATSLVTRVLKPRDYFSLLRRIRETKYPRSRSLSG